MSEQIQRYDMDGNKISLRNLCIQEPDWAVNRILHLELSHPTNDAKAMIAEGLEYHNMNNKKAPTPMWEPVLIGNIVREIDDKCQELSIHAVLDALLEVCKSNEQEGVKDEK